MPDYLVPDFEHPDHLPGEPVRLPLPPGSMAVRIALKVLRIIILGGLIAPLWLPFLIGVALTGHPPNVVRLGQAFYYLGLVWHIDGPEPPLPQLHKLWLTVRIIDKVSLMPLWGLAWMLDMLLYGRKLAAVPVRAPIIKIAAARSGSTQLAHYIEEDPRVVSPNVLQMLFPSIWMWKLAAATIGRWTTRERVSERVRGMLPPEFVERHEIDPFKTDTFEVGFYAKHLNILAFFLGTASAFEELDMAHCSPSTRRLWTETFVDLLEGTCRRALLYAGVAPDTRLFVKGHFPAAADALAERFPDGRFMTMVRRPSKRLQSMVNFLWSNPIERGLGKPPWSALVEGLAVGQVGYNRVEREWFTRPDGPQRLVLRFSDYVADLEGTMSRVYAECFDEDTLPDYVPRTHRPRERKNYSVNRSLEQLGVDGAAYDAAQPEFVAWCEGGDDAASPAREAAPSVQPQSTAATGASA